VTASEPVVSVIVPCYDEGDFVQTALASIAMQTFRQFEVVMSCDLATAATREICAAWAEKDRRFRFVENARRLGMTANWNRALGECRGKYVSKLDADDAMRPRFLELLLDELRAKGGRTAVFCRTLDCDDALEPQASYVGEQVFWSRGINPLRLHVKSGREWLRLCFDGYQLWHSNAMMLRRQFLEALGGWDERWGCASDTDLILRILEVDSQVVHHPYCGVLYRRRQGSVSDTYQAHGWKAVEGALIHLRSLLRQRRIGQSLDRASFRVWYSYWEGWQSLVRRLKIDREVTALPPGLRGTTIAVLTSEVSPPRSLRTMFWIRRGLGTASRRIRGLR
jgi:glycosyltransferase involved in cell wall biosynthesis